MASFFWNVRGFNKQLKHSIVKEWVNSNEMKFGCIIETRVKERKSASILNTVFSGWSSITNYEYSQGGRVWLVWRDSVRMSPVYKSDQMITCSVGLKEEDEFFCTFVYANNEVEDRRELWEDLCHHKNSLSFRNKAWMVMGDFNEILEVEESSEFFNSGRISRGMRDFQRAVLHCNLSDMGYQGPKFTWCNKREEGVICKKLDRVLLNDVAVQRFSNAFSLFEAGGCSDHLRCKIQVLPPTEKLKKPFKYVNAIGKLPTFLPTIKEYWDSTPVLFHSTSAMFRLSKKLKSLKPIIREVGKSQLGNLTKRASEAYAILCQKQQLTLSTPSANAVQEEADAYENWLFIAGLEEEFLKQRAKLHWLEIGDQNNKSFYSAIKSRQAQNTIREIRCGNGIMATNQTGIKEEAERFFSEFLNKTPEDYQGVREEELRDLLEFRCTEDESNMLEAQVTAEEIRRVLFAMPSNKSPGPDGFPSEFFETTWPILAHDFTVAVQSVFQFGFLPKGVNSTILALIPKKTDSLEMRDYRPIACCNVLYKVVSKILANRLKLILPRIVSETQSAFIKGRLLMENVLLASELVKDYHKEDISPRCLMKIDISKAFDSVQWDFVLRSLAALGVPQRFIHWIKLCISTPSFSVQVNGELAGYFQSSRGLRQGCSLSPYLFVLCMNVLSHEIDKAVREKKFNFHPRCKSLSLTHLCFADDLMVFVEGKKESVEGALSVFEEFSVWSGLSISLEKSTVYMAGVSDIEQRRILSNFPFAQGKLPLRYLGLSLMTRVMRRQDYMPLVERIRGVISTWTCRFLSYAGRLQLIKSVLMSIVNFWSAVFRLPSKCMKEIEQLCSAFLWTGPELKTSGAKVAWAEVCKPKTEGGLSIRALKEVNMVCGLKLIWRMLMGKSLWGRWINTYLLKGKSYWQVKDTTQSGSWMWRKLLKLRDVAKQFYRKEIGNGRHTSYWYDHWSDRGVLIEVLGERAIVEMGIRREASVEDAVLSRRSGRSYRNTVYNAIGAELMLIKNRMGSNGDDVSVWKRGSGYRKTFSTSETWLMLRDANRVCHWAKGIWFSQATPKFAFVTWLASLDRLSTMDRVFRWNQSIDTMCVLCRQANETRDHLFFECSYSAQVWEHLTRGILCGDYSKVWTEIVRLLMDGSREKKALFCLRYAFQACVYAVWRERNKIRHGDKPLPIQSLMKFIEKGIRNKLSLLRLAKVRGKEDSLQVWFATRL